MKFILYQNAAQWLDPINSVKKIEEGLISLENLWEAGDVLVLSEMFSTGFVTDPQILTNRKQITENQEYTLNWMRGFSQKNKITIVGSIPYCEGKLLFNRMFVAGEEADKEIWYDKRHLFGLAGEKTSYTPGDMRVIFDKGGLRINLSICYDLRFPVWLRNRGDYDILICVANWPTARSVAWRSLLIARAIENQCYVVGVNRVGIDGKNIAYGGGSLVVGPDGATLIEMNENEGIGFFRPDPDFLKKYRRAYPFLSDADEFSLI